MNAITALAPEARYHKTETEREKAQTSATTLITNLLRCVLWLIKSGIPVIGFTGQRAVGGDRITVTVAASPYLYTLFRNDCAWRTRRQEGALVYYTWFAERFGIRIEWEEVSACA